MPIKLYHGTVERIAKLAPHEGISPYTVPHNEQEPVFSTPEQIYLTTVYAPYQAFTAAQTDERWAIVEVLWDRLQDRHIQPASEWLHGTLKGKNRTWLKSIETVGLCVHNGLIPKQAIGKVWIYNPQSNWLITRAILHISISIKGYKEDQRRLSALNRWLTGEFLGPEEWLAEQKGHFTKEQKDEISIAWHDRSGLDLFYHGS